MNTIRDVITDAVNLYTTDPFPEENYLNLGYPESRGKLVEDISNSLLEYFNKQLS